MVVRDIEMWGTRHKVPRYSGTGCPPTTRALGFRPCSKLLKAGRLHLS